MAKTKSSMVDEKHENSSTTVRVEKHYNEILGTLCKRLGLSRKEFLEHSITYFSQAGRDPRQGKDEVLTDRLASLESTLKRFQSDWHSSKNSWEKGYLKPGLENEQNLLRSIQDLHYSLSADVLAELVGVIVGSLGWIGISGNVENRDMVLNGLKQVVDKSELRGMDAEKIKQVLENYRLNYSK